MIPEVGQLGREAEQALVAVASVAMEFFEGAVDGREGTFDFVHSAATSGDDRANEFDFGAGPAGGAQ
ncbi:DUF3224 domain-containing protein [Streptomyces sp. NPDC057136]|uniref:DUF3224 domain-containing protein n=1 Tax=Streptomyces sp. NPDC057136 TaxID=3346029 RepID=UPI003633DCA4